jgi:DNA-binding GntR family transcriptional regulator
MNSERTVEVSGTQPVVELRDSVARIYSSLRMLIVDGGIAPGERMNIERIAREHDMSPTPVREALRQLESEGLVVYSPGRGYRTTPVLDLTGLRAVFEFRMLVEPWAARSAAADRMTNPAQELAALLSRFESDARSGGDVRQAMLVHDTNFHKTVLAATDNPVVQQAYRQTHCHLHVFRFHRVDLSGEATIAEHRAIWRAVKACDPDAAEIEMSEHIRHSYERSVRSVRPADGPSELSSLAAPVSPGRFV